MRLIDADELLEGFKYTIDANGNAIRYRIKCAPTVELVQHEKWVDDLIPNKKYVPENWSAYNDYAFERGWNACVDTVKEKINELR